MIGKLLGLNEQGPGVVALGPGQGQAPSDDCQERLSILAPDIVEAILDGQQGPEVTLARVLEPFLVSWSEHRNSFSCT